VEREREMVEVGFCVVVFFHFTKTPSPSIHHPPNQQQKERIIIRLKKYKKKDLVHEKAFGKKARMHLKKDIDIIHV
jgi:hypothetical protein